MTIHTTASLLEAFRKHMMTYTRCDDVSCDCMTPVF